MNLEISTIIKTASIHEKGVLIPIRQALADPDLVLEHITEEGATFSVSLQDIKIPSKPNFYWYNVLIETAQDKKIEINLAVLSAYEYERLCSKASIDLYLKQTEAAAEFFLEKAKEKFKPEIHERFTLHQKAQLFL